MDYFLTLSPVMQAFIATLFTWFMTALGAALVFCFRKFNQALLDTMLGFGAGVMIAASCWSLLIPAIEMSGQLGFIPWVPPVIGFLAGGLFLRVLDRFLPHLHIGFPKEQAEGVKTSWKRSILLVMAITIHNIPEGLAVGVAFGAVAAGVPAATIGAAIALAIGIGIQNFPEGTAISVPLRREGLSCRKAFWYGQLSGMVEPIAAIFGAALVLMVMPILPYALAFAAGAMIYVVVEELIPESQVSGNTDIATLGTLIGFVVMMALDVGLG